MNICSYPFPFPPSPFPFLQMWFLLIALILLTGCQQPQVQTYPQVQISRVMSGQSIEWVDRSQQPPLIQQGRLAGIDAPDLAQDPWGQQAKQRLEGLIGVLGKDNVGLEVESAAPDKYDRKFIYLWKDGRLLNEQLTREGLVLVSLRNPSASSSSGGKYRDRLSRSSQYARLIGVGIWNPKLPMRMSPSEFRKEERN